MRHLDRFQRLGYRTDLVQLDQNRVAAMQGDTLMQTLGVGYEQVVANQLYSLAQLLSHHLPAFPVLFIQAILDGVDRVLVAQALPVCYQLSGGELLTGLGQYILALLLALPLTGSSIDRQYEILARLITGLLNSLKNQLNRLFVACQVRCETALITYGGSQALALQQRCQSVEYLSTPAQTFLEALSAYRHNHELLYIYGVGRMCAAVQDVHHRNRQTITADSAQETIQRNIQCQSCRSCAGNGYCQNRVRAQIGLILGSVSLDHRCVYRIDIRSIHSLQRIVDYSVDVLHCLGNALSAKAALIAITKLQSLKLSGRSSARSCASAYYSTRQNNLCLYCRIASGVDNLSTNYLLDTKFH